MQQQRYKLQSRLIGYNSIKITRIAVGVEGSASVLSIIEGASVNPNLRRGWDTGLEVDDDGG